MTSDEAGKTNLLTSPGHIQSGGSTFASDLLNSSEPFSFPQNQLHSISKSSCISEISEPRGKKKPTALDKSKTPIVYSLTEYLSDDFPLYHSKNLHVELFQSLR